MACLPIRRPHSLLCGQKSCNGGTLSIGKSRACYFFPFINLSGMIFSLSQLLLSPPTSVLFLVSSVDFLVDGGMDIGAGI